MASKAKKTLSSSLSSSLPMLFDEEEWVIQIRDSLEKEIEEADAKTPVSIFRVPPALVACKPEAYVPQLFAFGPYHHWRQELYDMERYKLATARRVQARVKGALKFDQIVALFMTRDFKIRCCYHKHLDINPDTLAWMMAIDASFLLEFLQNLYLSKQEQGQQDQALAKTASKRAEAEKMTIGFNMIVRDMLMLENQIPLFLLRRFLSVVYSSKEVADEELTKILLLFVKEVSPFKTSDDALPAINSQPRCAHLLELVYVSIVPLSKDLLHKATPEDDENQEDGDGEKKKEEVKADPTLVRQALNWLWRNMSRINGGPMGLLKRLLFSRPMRLVVQVPWKVITALPIFSLIKLPVESFFSSFLPKAKTDDAKSADAEKPPLVEEISIPAVSELTSSGVKFAPTATGDLTTITFDTKTATMYLPEINLDENTEVLLRNLVAYEASAVMTGPMVFTRYTELMYGIIDTEEDVGILRRSGVVVNRLKSDGEAAELWNGMSKSVRLSKVGFLDKAIRDVNKFYSSRWKVKTKEFTMKYVFGAWPILTLLAAGLMLFLTFVQAFCSVYSCSSHWKELSDMGGAGGGGGGSGGNS